MGSTTFSGPVTSKAGFIMGTDVNSTLTASATITQETYNGQIINLSAAAGMTITLPAATGTNAMYRFVVSTSVTSNSYKIQVANATDVMVGTGSVAGTTGTVFSTLTASDTLTMNGSTQGGAAGSYIEIIDVAAGEFIVRANLLGSGTPITPFSAAVS
tara:strand:- start:35027 stop:35500 length:474 start_codon:yes stop_codon:yes gene_type:complete